MVIFSSVFKSILSKFSDLSKENKDLVGVYRETLGRLNQIQQIKDDVNEELRTIQQMKAEATSGQKWLSDAIADFYHLRDVKIAQYLKDKPQPALKAAEQISAIAKEKRILLRELKEIQYKVAYYESLFPSLTDYIDEPSDLDEFESYDDTVDRVSLYLTPQEYANLGTVERNQLALDRYKKRKHSKSHLGKMYERYIGWLYEVRGFRVEYFGIKKGLNDLGRDLICEDDEKIYVVQCKCWSKSKVIRENAICQLYGSFVKFKIEERKRRALSHCGKKVVPIFVTTTEYSPVAKEFAEELGVQCHTMGICLDYPLIKCNVSASGEKIYHLPFDQQYDSTLIKNTGEVYRSTVAEAEKDGFRRAKRWMDGTTDK